MLPETSSMTMSRMGCGRVVEQRDRLRLPFVAHLEVVLRERRDEPAVSIRDGDEDAHGVARAAEDRLLPPGRAKHAKDTRGERSVREKPRHGQHLTYPPGRHLQSYHGPLACGFEGRDVSPRQWR